MKKEMRKQSFDEIMVEPTNICNLKCPVCLTGGNYDKRKKGNMGFPQFKKILDPITGSLKSINLWGFGEPFLAPDILKMIDYLDQNNVSVNLHTNGTTLDKKTINHFKKNQKISLTFSIDGITDKTYLYYRRGGNLKKALGNLSYLVDLKRKNNLSNIQTVWQFLVMKSNEHEVLGVEKMAKEMGIDKLRLKTISVGEQHSLYDDLIPRKKSYQRKGNRVVRKGECIFIEPGTPTVLFNGDIVPCCHDYFDEHIFGNALKEGVISVWNNAKYREFRNDYRKGTNPLCNKKCKFTQKSKIYLKEMYFK